MTTRSTALAALAALIVAAPMASPAQAAPDDEGAIAAARKHYDRAVAHQEAERYAEAAAEYLEAHALYPDPEFYFNAAQMYRLDGQLQLARKLYRRYVKAEPDGRASDEARGHIEDIERALAERDRPVAEKEPGEGAGRSGGDEAKEDDDERSPPGRRLRIAGITAMLAGAAALGVGVKFGLDAKEASDELTANTGAWTDELLARQDDGERSERVFLIATGAGAAAIAVGAALYLRGYQDARSASGVAIAPMAGRLGLTVSARF